VTDGTEPAGAPCDDVPVPAPIVIRPIRPSDAALLAEGMRRLSPESVRRRFLAPRSKLTSRELRYLTEVDGCRHYALVAVLADDPGELVGVGRWVRLDDRPATAEVAITVGDPYQGQGIGKQLGLALADAARARGIKRFTATMLADNEPAHRLFKAISQRLESVHSGGLDEVTAELSAA
jgi:RimJ/RimL family protein N-acetyltransferase